MKVKIPSVQASEYMSLEMNPDNLYHRAKRFLEVNYSKDAKMLDTNRAWPQLRHTFKLGVKDPIWRNFCAQLAKRLLEDKILERTDKRFIYRIDHAALLTSSPNKGYRNLSKFVDWDKLELVDHVKYDFDKVESYVPFRYRKVLGSFTKMLSDEQRNTAVLANRDWYRKHQAPALVNRANSEEAKPTITMPRYQMTQVLEGASRDKLLGLATSTLEAARELPSQQAPDTRAKLIDLALELLALAKGK
jgi:hypothetical protein